MPTYTPEQITEILDAYFSTRTDREYIGMRYVPIFGRKGESSIEWDGGIGVYEPLTIVLHEGNSYTSRQYVPVGIDISNSEYWAQTGNFNAQIERLSGEISILEDYVKWPPVHDLNMFGLISMPERSLDDVHLYIEDITYNKNANVFYFGMSNGDIIVISDIKTLSIVHTYENVIDSAIGMIDYNDYTNEIYITAASGRYILDANTMNIKQTITLGYSHLCYDSKRKQILSYSGYNGIATINEYDSSLVLTNTYTVNYETENAITQGGCCDNGIIYTSNQEEFIEIDYINNRAYIMGLAEDYRGSMEPEAAFIYNDELFISCNQFSNRYNSFIYKYNFSALWNINYQHEDWKRQNLNPTLRGGILIPEGTDLNDIKDIGNFYTNYSSNNVPNCPPVKNKVFKMEVYQENLVGDRLGQHIVFDGPPFEEFRRRLINNQWSDWVRVSTEYINIDMQGSQSYTFKMTTSIAIVFASRGSNYQVILLNYWSDTPIEIAGSEDKIVNIVKNTNSTEFTVTNLKTNLQGLFVLV